MTSIAPLPESDNTWPGLPALPRSFFDRDALELARALIGKILRRRLDGLWLSARIIETEAYYLVDRGSHASLGYTAKRHPLFVEEGGTIYMYYARGGDSLNFSAHGAGNAVLIKSAHPWLDARAGAESLARMQALNPRADGSPRPPEQLCAGQTLLCKSLALRVPDWSGRLFSADFYVEDVGLRPSHLVQTTRLGIPPGRDEHLPYRYVDPDYARHATRNPLRRGQVEDVHYTRIDVRDA
ncbi:DNA-3-methyladenine glycosylase [Verticiella sediminum]|uniref:Putative 3-methyladenine DNA glycosylase n=1 Tax=Verticiella sediminum TaxID=1247510 RepID=A0A556A7K8_9BURK|nr:DNA-3-methyladenine glycosylase [Verticiella sediminum]TSH88886.1 DNA-3-methyladenine glycosylase [Verticiella sediminum]